MAATDQAAALVAAQADADTAMRAAAIPVRQAETEGDDVARIGAAEIERLNRASAEQAVADAEAALAAL